MRSRLVAFITAASLVAALGVGTTFAGKTNGTAGGADNGNKTGTWHKNDTYTCTDGYSLYSEGSVNGYNYDLNGDGYVCAKWVDSDWYVVDDIRSSD